MATNLTVPVLVGGSQEVLQRDYAIRATPATYLLDEHGRVVFHQDGYKTGDEKNLEARIAAVLDAASAVATTASALPRCPDVAAKP